MRGSLRSVQHHSECKRWCWICNRSMTSRDVGQRKGHSCKGKCTVGVETKKTKTMHDMY